MPSDIGHRRGPLVSFSGALISYAHTFLGAFAFLGALFVALSLHYEKVVKNGVARYPDEWFPSVSATIGDWYPERNLFQVGIALMSGPRIALVLLSALLVSLSTSVGSKKPTILVFVGLLRTLACGGWVYVTSSDDHDFHDVAMIVYLVLTPPWMYITSGSLSPRAPSKISTLADPRDAGEDQLARKAKKMRRIAAGSFFGCIPFMVHFFIRHKVKRIPGAYTHYAFFEWGLIIFDLLFDAASAYDLARLDLQVVEASRSIAADAVIPSIRLVSGTWVESGQTGAVSSGVWSNVPEGKGTDQPQTAYKVTTGGPQFKGHIEERDPGVQRDVQNFVFDLYLAFCFWSTWTALHPTIFFFSVYNMGIGGHELLLISQNIGIGLVLAIPALRRLFSADLNGSSHLSGGTSNKKLAVLWSFSLIGIASWWQSSPLFRLLAVALSNGAQAVAMAVEWGAAWEKGQLRRKATVWTLGMVLSSLAKYANHANNPVWPFLNETNGGWNWVGLFIGGLCVVLLYTRPQTEAGGLVKVRTRQGPRFSATMASLGLAASLFSLHSMLSDSGTLIAWTWTGYPITGPTAVRHGILVLAACSVSVLLSFGVPSLPTHPAFFLFGCISAFVLHQYEDWTGFAGAIGMALFLPALVAPLALSAMQHNPLRIMLVTWLVTNVLTFLQVLTVAYAFVPGGQLMRERTGFVLSTQLLFLGIGVFNARRREQQSFQGQSARAEVNKPRNVRLMRLLAISAFALTVGARLVSRMRTVAPESIVPYHTQDRLFTAGIWTVHFSLDQHMYDSTRRISSIVKELELDILGLLETDLQRIVYGNRDMTQWLAEELGMYADLGPGPSKNTWGAILLSKFPIINSTHHLLPSPNGELAPAIHAVLDIFGTPTHVIVSHNGQEEDPLDRKLQTTEIARIFREAYPHPALFLGYVVTKPHAPRPNPYQILFEDGKIHDIEPSDWQRWCEYIGFRGLLRIGYARVSRYTVTDTELQTGKFIVPPADKPINPDVNVLTRLVDNSTVPAAWQYPSRLIDPGAMVYNRHKYSPYYWPRYYGPEI